MLPPAHRMRRRSDFAVAVKSGRRAAGRYLVLHGREPLPGSPTDQACLVGFVVPRAVGNAVVRNRVQRRLRHRLIPLAPALPAGSRVVVRVLPAAAGATSDQLDDELKGLLARLERRWAQDRAEVEA
jgi:ribonuclease P protein component